MIKFLLPFFLVGSLAFTGKVNCTRKVDTSETPTVKHYTWYFWSSTPPCTSKPGEDADVSYCTYSYARLSKVIVKNYCGTCNPGDVQ